MNIPINYETIEDLETMIAHSPAFKDDETRRAFIWLIRQLDEKNFSFVLLPGEGSKAKDSDDARLLEKMGLGLMAALGELGRFLRVRPGYGEGNGPILFVGWSTPPHIECNLYNHQLPRKPIYPNHAAIAAIDLDKVRSRMPHFTPAYIPEITVLEM